MAIYFDSPTYSGTTVTKEEFHKGIRNWQFTWQSYIYRDHMTVLHIPGPQLQKRNSNTNIGLFVFLWEFNRRRRTGYCITVMDTYNGISVITKSVPEEGYSRNAPCALNSISTFLLYICVCSTKPLSKLLIYILSATKTWRQRYCGTSYSQMVWIRCGLV